MRAHLHGNYLPFFSSHLHLWSFVRLGGGRRTFSGFSKNILLGSSPGHSKTFTALCINHSCCVLRVIVLLEGEPSAQSEVLNALGWVFIKSISIVWCIELCPTAWSCYQHTLLSGWYSAGDEQSLVSFKHDVWNGGSSDQIIWFLTVWGSFRCFFVNSKCVFFCLHWGEDCIWPHNKAHIGGVLQWCLSFCRYLLSPHTIIEFN